MDIQSGSLQTKIGPSYQKYIRLLTKNKPYIEKFCEDFGVCLFGVGITYENSKPEPAYLFSDGMGYYTIRGIKKSLSS